MNDEQLHRFVELKVEQHELEAKLESVKKELSTLEGSLLEQFSDSGIDSVKVNGMTCYLQRQVWASPKDGDHGRLATALSLCGYGDLVKTSINSQSLSALVREFEANEQPLPSQLQDAVKVSEVFHLRTRRS